MSSFVTLIMAITICWRNENEKNSLSQKCCEKKILDFTELYITFLSAECFLRKPRSTSLKYCFFIHSHIQSNSQIAVFTFTDWFFRRKRYGKVTNFIFSNNWKMDVGNHNCGEGLGVGSCQVPSGRTSGQVDHTGNRGMQALQEDKLEVTTGLRK